MLAYSRFIPVTNVGMNYDADTINTMNKESERETFSNITLIDDGELY